MPTFEELYRQAEAMHERKKNLREEWQRKREQKEKDAMRDKPQICNKPKFRNVASPQKSKASAYSELAK